MKSRSRPAAMVAAFLPLFVVTVTATGLPTIVRVLAGAAFVMVSLVVLARTVAHRQA